MKTLCDVMNNVFNSPIPSNTMMLFMGLFLVITLKNADGIAPKTVQQKQFCWGRRDALQVSVFQQLGGFQGLVLETLGEPMNCIPFKQSSRNSAISQQGFKINI